MVRSAFKIALKTLSMIQILESNIQLQLPGQCLAGVKAFARVVIPASVVSSHTRAQCNECQTGKTFQDVGVKHDQDGLPSVALNPCRCFPARLRSSSFGVAAFALHFIPGEGFTIAF